jgi:hypothetical protein
VFRGFEAWIGGAIFVYALILSGSMLISLAIPYVVLRMRDKGSPSPDPQIGIKSALYYFFSVGIILVLTGLTTLVMDVLVGKGPPAPGGGLNDFQRASLGVMTAGMICAFLHLGLIKGMTDDRNPMARRIFAGWRLAIHGMVVVITITILLGVVFQKDFGGDSMKDFRKQLLGILLVWVPSWLLHLVLVGIYSRPLYEPRRPIHDD